VFDCKLKAGSVVKLGRKLNMFLSFLVVFSNDDLES